MLKEKCGDEVISASHNIDLATLPPCRRSFKQHVHRCNYQVAIWKRSDQPVSDIRQPTEGHAWTMTEGHGWTMKNKVLEPLWQRKKKS